MSGWVQARTVVGVGAACVLLGAGADILAAVTGRNIVIPFEEVQFPPLTPLGGSTVSGGQLWKDPNTGGGSVLIKFTKGSTDKHLHTFDYQLTVIKGTVTHWTEKLPEAGAMKLTPGSYWFQPKDELHQDTCLVDECIIFVHAFSGGETKTVKDK